MRQVAAVLISMALVGVGPAMGIDPAVEKAALQAAEEWLELIDTGELDKSWETAAGYFKNAVTRDQWRQSLSAARGPLGKVLSREVKAATYATTLPGAPDGEYVVIQFESSFEKKLEAIETVTPMLDEDGAWRISGYYIR